VRVPRPPHEPGKGAYWTLEQSYLDGSEDPRKREKRSSRAQVGFILINPQSDPVPYSRPRVISAPKSAPLPSSLFHFGKGFGGSNIAPIPEFSGDSTSFHDLKDFTDLGVVASYGPGDEPMKAFQDEGETNGYDQLPALFNLPPRTFRQGSVSGELFSYGRDDGMGRVDRQPSFVDFGLGFGDGKNVSVMPVDVAIPQLNARVRRDESGEGGAK
jgi:hypothetical protein